MFCPNCRAQNPDDAVTCSNCGFNLAPKGAGTPKFKGTMLMMNSPIVGAPQPTPPADPAGPPSAAPRSNLKGTIVGVAPPAAGAAAPPGPPFGGMGGSFAPPGVDAGGVNPMGSTFVADTPSPVAFPPPASGGAAFGVQPPPVDPGYGPPTQPTPAPMMAPYGAPAPQAPYGAPQPSPYGAPPQQAPLAPPAENPYGAAPLAIAPPTGMVGPGPGYGDAGAMAPYTPPGALAGPAGTPRNPVTVLILSSFCLWVGWNQLRQIETELNRLVGKNEPGSILWLLFPLIPLLGMPKLIAAARARAGTATQGEPSLPLYLFLGPYSLPKDANEIWAALGSRPA